MKIKTLVKHYKMSSKIIVQKDNSVVTLVIKGFKVKGTANNPALSRGENGEDSLYDIVNSALDKAYKENEDAIVFNPQSVVVFLNELIKER